MLNIIIIIVLLKTHRFANTLLGSEFEPPGHDTCLQNMSRPGGQQIVRRCCLQAEGFQGLPEARQHTLYIYTYTHI
jgi:hypothetical protein